ncbi:MAG: acylneuraminate cytidylyltransferase family protein [Planctomycetota bacterium]
MPTLAVIIARAGSQGLPRKNALPCAGRSVLDWTIDHASISSCIDRVVLSTDGDELKAIASFRGIETIHRPHVLANAEATVDAAARHAVQTIDPEGTFDDLVILYGNVPVRPSDLSDRAIAKLRETGCDSVQSVCPVGKHHPYWMKELAGDNSDRMVQHVANRAYRRQDLPPLYELDGGVIAVTRESLFVTHTDEPHAFLGIDRRAIVTKPGEVIDIDETFDLDVAEAILNRRERQRETLALPRRAAG